MNIKDLEAAALEASKLMKALSSERRLLILCHLFEDEKSVGELAGELGLNQASLSHQLGLLRKDGLVKTRRERQTIYYSLAGTEARAVISVLHELYCTPSGAGRSANAHGCERRSSR